VATIPKLSTKALTVFLQRYEEEEEEEEERLTGLGRGFTFVELF
jgi:hypothetical protein